MKSIVIIGAGGCAREVAWLMEEINSKNKIWNILGFIDDNKTIKGKKINGYEVLGNIEEFEKNFDEDIQYIIGIGNGKVRKIIEKKIKKHTPATLIHPNVKISKTNTIGKGSIICSRSILTVNINIGEHVVINLNSTISHDVRIGSYSTVLSNVNVSGNVSIGENVMLGVGTKIIQNITIGENSIVGAGTVVIRDVKENSTVVGNPARLIKIAE